MCCARTAALQGVKEKLERRPKNDQEEPNASKKRTTGAKDAKKRARERKRANMDPTWRSLDLDLGSFWPPLRKEKQYVKASIKCSGV